jgi:hypothetical protein
MDEALVNGWELKPIYIRVVRKWGYESKTLKGLIEEREAGKKLTTEETQMLNAGTLSELTIDGTDFKADIFEERGPSSEEKEKDFRIPVGAYSLRWNIYSTSRHKDRLHLYNKSVPAGRGILIHAAFGSQDTHSDTAGCLLIGAKRFNTDGSVDLNYISPEEKDGKKYGALLLAELESIVKEKEVKIGDDIILNAKLIITEEFSN